ncbi:hypothetical protein [Streptomyces sp. NBC_00091]|uniref:hypothetical protein n=1 Tax=Streptomyces sp. NBC_00091 TaxID=2975648 RepID=UPI002253946D|nr:hypothetical protein [Streptomyces sp. NBC_00091]MCX5377371.1 hypothetical protein [Streptomyces sp. NBC_00091]
MTFPSAAAVARGPLLPRPAVYRPLTGPWRSLDWYAGETMHAAGVRDARSIAADRWDGPSVVCLKDRVAALAKGQVEPVALRLAAIGVNCGWSEVVSGEGRAVDGVPPRFAALWAAVGRRIGTFGFDAAPLLAVVNHAVTAWAGEGARPALAWSATDAPSRIDLLLAAAARMDAVNGSVLLKSHLLEFAEARPLTAVRGLDRIVQVQAIVREVLERRLEAMAAVGCPPAGITAARTLAADPPEGPDGIPPRLVTPVQQAVEALLGRWRPDAAGAGRHLGREQFQAVADLAPIGGQVRDLARARKEVGVAYDGAVAAVRHSNLLYRRLIDAAGRQPAPRGGARCATAG